MKKEEVKDTARSVPGLGARSLLTVSSEVHNLRIRRRERIATGTVRIQLACNSMCWLEGYSPLTTEEKRKRRRRTRRGRTKRTRRTKEEEETQNTKTRRTEKKTIMC